MQGGIQSGHLLPDERPVGGDGIARQRSRVGGVAVLLDQRQHRILRILQGHGGLFDQGGQAGRIVHPGHEIIHPGQLLIGGVHHQIHTLAEDVEVGVGDQGGDLHDDMAFQIQAGHLQIDPHQAVITGSHGRVVIAVFNSFRHYCFLISSSSNRPSP